MTRPEADVVFLGRDEELSRMGARWGRVLRSEPQIVVVTGPGGIGKTSLVRHFLDTVPADTRVLWASGEESEAHLPYALLAQLVDQASCALDPPLPDLGRYVRPGVPVPDPVLVGAATLDAIGRTEHRAPLVLVIDDAHWADSPSLHALAFALRRLRVDRVLAVLVARDAADPRLPGGLRRILGDDHTLKVRLEGLAVPELRRLVTGLGLAPLPRWAATRLWEHTHGNPLHTVALLRQFPAEVYGAAGTVLPAPRAYELLVAARLDRCGPEARRLVEAAGVSGMSSPLHTVARIADVAEPLEALAAAMEAGLLVAGPAGETPRAVFPHPLSRAAVYQGLRPALRSRLHERAARAADHPGVALHHRAHAATGPDAELAAEIHRFADAQAAEGAWSAAAAAALAASRLAPDEAHRTAWFLHGVELLLLAGDVSQAAELEDLVREVPAGAERHYVLGHLALTSGRLAEARRELTACWDSCDARTPVETVRCTAEQLASLYLIECDNRQAIAWSRRGLDVPQGRRSSYLRESLAIGLALEGRDEEALKSVAHLPVEGPRNGPEELDGLMARGLIQLWSGQLRAARRDLSDAFRCHRRGGLPYVGLVALGFLVDAEYRAGEWDDAVVHGTQAVSLAEDTDQVSVLAVVHAFAAAPLAGRGDFEAARAHAAAAVRYARTLADINDTALARTALATVRGAQGDHDAVIAALEPLLDPGIAHRATLDVPGPVPWRPLLVESLVRTGRLDEAERHLVPYEESAAAHDRWLDRAAAARCRGVLEAARGATDRAEQAFVAGLGHLARGEPCWEEAQSQLAYGTFLRRTARRGPAVARLQSAWDLCHRTGATPSLRRCAVELAACGRAVAPASDTGHPELTAQELTVANLAASGLTNRQIARELVLSVKTVEYHLGHAYTKLGIRSRTALAARLASGT